ncbi:RHS repeat-associated core domain-containing protein, partial [Dokdonella soli]|uniref:RHS repeat-associated core domain-containing protein n=1 Tax=Dokdonella soli TaxID=529810 RepID=UPI00360B8D8A
PGQYYDAETGLNYSYQRDYESITGRYVESDPTGLAGGINTYAYVDDSPLNGIDPDGLAASFPSCSGGCHSPPPVPFPTPGPKPGPAPSIPGFSLHPPPGLSLGIDIIKMCLETLDCEYQYYKVDIPTCKAISRRRGATAGRACYASASDRYAACRRGDPIPPLNTWNN